MQHSSTDRCIITRNVYSSALLFNSCFFFWTLPHSHLNCSLVHWVNRSVRVMSSVNHHSRDHGERSNILDFSPWDLLPQRMTWFLQLRHWWDEEDSFSIIQHPSINLYHHQWLKYLVSLLVLNGWTVCCAQGGAQLQEHFFFSKYLNWYRSLNTRTEHRQPLCCAFCPVMHEERDWYAGMHSDSALLNKRLDEWVKLCMKTIQRRVSMYHAQYGMLNNFHVL